MHRQWGWHDYHPALPNVQIDADTWHTATSAWYTVDAYGRGRDDVMETEVTFPGLSLAELAAYMGTPETLTYVQEAEGRNEWKITDGETIVACLKALEQMKVGEKTDLRAADAGDTLLFTMADGSTWTLDFENGNLCGTAAAMRLRAGRPFGRY